MTVYEKQKKRLEIVKALTKVESELISLRNAEPNAEQWETIGKELRHVLDASFSVRVEIVRHWRYLNDEEYKKLHNNPKYLPSDICLAV